MRYDREHKAQTHRRIVKSAARKVRADGITGAGLLGVMKSSGLTVGGFYKHFHSKDELIEEAIGESLLDSRGRMLEAAKRAPAGQGWKVFVTSYLSMEHCEAAERGCPLAALSSEIGRAKPAVRKRIVEELKRHREAIIPLVPGRSAAEKQKNFFIAMSAMSGAVSLARVLVEPKAKQAILDAVREHLLIKL